MSDHIFVLQDVASSEEDEDPSAALRLLVRLGVGEPYFLPFPLL